MKIKISKKVLAQALQKQIMQGIIKRKTQMSSSIKDESEQESLKDKQKKDQKNKKSSVNIKK